MNESQAYGCTQLFKARQSISEMKVELNEHRFYLEQKVAFRSNDLLKRIAVLESCHLALCEKLDSAGVTLG